MSGPVPEAWTHLMGHHRAAQVAQDQMKDPGASQVARDEATVRYAPVSYTHLTLPTNREV